MSEQADRIKILITNTCQHIVCYLYEEDLSVNYYTVIDPMIVCYHEHEFDDNSLGRVEASFMRFCALSTENLYEIRKDWIVAITEPSAGVLGSYLTAIQNPSLETVYHDCNSDSAE